MSAEGNSERREATEIETDEAMMDEKRGDGRAVAAAAAAAAAAVVARGWQGARKDDGEPRAGRDGKR